MKIVIGVGNELRKDDGIGVKIVKSLSREKIKNVRFFIGYETPENLIEKIKTLKPTKVFIVDAVNFSGRVGEVKKIEAKKTPFFTHKPDYKFFKNFLDCDVEIIGIQPKDLSYGEDLSNELSSKFEKIKEDVRKIILSKEF